MPDIDMALRILPDIGRYPELKTSAMRPEVGIFLTEKDGEAIPTDTDTPHFR